MAKNKKLSVQEKQQRAEKRERKRFLFEEIQKSIEQKNDLILTNSNPVEINNKVAAMLMSLCEPTFSVLKGEEQLIVSVAVIAWNMSIAPQAYNLNELKQGLKTHKKISSEGANLVVEVAEVLKDAKESFYPEVKCIIQKYTYKDLGNAHHLQVVVLP